MRCHACGEPVDPEDRFCAACGEVVEQAAEQTGVIGAVSTGTGPIQALRSGRGSDLPPGSALLIVHRGPGEGGEYPLEAGADVITVGRSPESGIFLDDVTVSRRHAEFRHGGEGWSVRDSGSLNGTYVNRKRVDSLALRGGEEVQIGKFRFVFLAGPEG
jgi:hypothetical protein